MGFDTTLGCLVHSEHSEFEQETAQEEGEPAIL
jgi:hypothetical protein